MSRTAPGRSVAFQRIGNFRGGHADKASTDRVTASILTRRRFLCTLDWISFPNIFFFGGPGWIAIWILNGWDFCLRDVNSDKLNELLSLQFAKTPLKMRYVDGQDGTTDRCVVRSLAGHRRRRRHQAPYRDARENGEGFGSRLDRRRRYLADRRPHHGRRNRPGVLFDTAAAKSHLKFNFLSVSKQLGDPKNGAFTIVNPDLHGLLPSQGAIWTALDNHVPDWLIGNNGFLSYIFASLNLAPTGAASWLTPHGARYCCVNGAAGSTGISRDHGHGDGC